MLAVDPLAYLMLAGGPEEQAAPTTTITAAQLTDVARATVTLADSPANPR